MQRGERQMGMLTATVSSVEKVLAERSDQPAECACPDDRVVEEKPITAALTRRAGSFVHGDGHRLYSEMSSDIRDHWLNHGIPATVVDRMAAFEAMWGGLLLPPAPHYEGGPKIFRSDMPEMDSTGDWWFDAGDQRFSMPYGFFIGPRGEFGIEDSRRRAVLHESVAGWVESLALVYRAAHWASEITKVRGAAVDRLDLSNLEPFPEVAGVSDTWWRGGEKVIAVYRGEAHLFNDPELQVATVYDGIAEAPIYLDY
ncbi:hypothetical protein NCC78_00330 [Micromonospora phytophila]|uniref:hypothetical protein n=1 Tax=Micromonospora phytophila TaxID=709888 RepID=UPI00202F6CA0|nr:hypothetical protein [Micromonospora phytophila]MCM0673183.1 hypothetical protein [Micromonospora phytophila]